MYEWKQPAPPVPVGQLIPGAGDVTVPLPAPAVVTVRANVESVKVAVTFVAAVIETVQVVLVLVPVQTPPDQPVGVEPFPAAAVRVTLSLAANSAEHVVPVVPQLMPPVSEVTFPVPLPALVTFRA